MLNRWLIHTLSSSVKQQHFVLLFKLRFDSDCKSSAGTDIGMDKWMSEQITFLHLKLRFVSSIFTPLCGVTVTKFKTLNKLYMFFISEL